jgi:uncharacterized protein YecT (DUF1311 family)
MKNDDKLLLALAACLLTSASPRVAHAQSQVEMNGKAARDFEVADAKLNKVYKEAMQKLDAGSQAKLKTAQLAWISFRDAEAALEVDVEARGGSIDPVIYDGTRIEMTNARTDELLKLLKNGIE